jgi:hypothetical protein
MLWLHSARMKLNQAMLEDTVAHNKLVDLHTEVKSASLQSMFEDWRATSTFLPLAQERLLSCTGDPKLRNNACWIKRPGGTFLDFGWSRTKREMPKEWSFFVQCKSEDLLSCLVEIMHTVAEVKHQLPGYEPWQFVKTGQVLHSLYRRNILQEPQSPSKTKSMEHILYVVAATELLNTSEKTNVSEFEERLIASKIFKEKAGGRYELADIRSLLQRPLSEIVTIALYPEHSLVPSGLDRRRSDTADVFDPEHLRLNLLVDIGGLSVKWTEYLHEHLTFDTTNSTVYVYWFASHLEHNSMFQ